jgi:hypothetical protein
MVGCARCRWYRLSRGEGLSFIKIAMIEKSSEAIVTTIPVSLGGLNYQPSQSEFYAEAWRSALVDKLVDAGKKI